MFNQIIQVFLIRLSLAMHFAPSALRTRKGESDVFAKTIPGVQEEIPRNRQPL
jgi:hypothetical protein